MKYILIVILLIVAELITYFIMKHTGGFDGVMQVDTQRDIYRLVLNDLDSISKKKAIKLKVENHILSSLKED